VGTVIYAMSGLEDERGLGLYMRISDGRDVIGIYVLDCDLALGRRVTDFPSCLVDIFVMVLGSRIDLFGLLAQEPWHVWDRIAAAVSLVEVMLLRHGTD
jgi:hypothetical protein